MRTFSSAPERLPSAWRRRFLWSALTLLMVVLITTLVWLAARYENSQLQSQLERDAAETVADLRQGLSRNVQSLQALQFSEPSPASWAVDAASFLREHRELVRIEWRDNNQRIKSQADTPFRTPVFERMGRDSVQAEVTQACSVARKTSGPAYVGSYYLPLSDGLGFEVMELCLPLFSRGQPSGYLVATYALQLMLDEWVGQTMVRSQEVSFTEGDGTRLAVRGSTRRTSRVFSSQQLLDLPNVALVLRINSWRSAPDLFPNVLTALVTAMSIAIVSILVLLSRDMRRRLKAESALADALAYRKAMEDSLVTGLRARDLFGRITYVNPAFCHMVGFSAEELLGQSVNAPYWPPELSAEYQKRQAIRLAGNSPPREGFESVFMHKDGSRFPVLIIEAPLINAQGQQTGWMSAFLDIREQRRVEDLSRASTERLQATARLATVGEMASLLSHELNQPLAAISSYASGSLNLIKEAPHIEAEIGVALRRIAEQAERAGRVIKSVHDFVRRRDQAREALAFSTLVDAILPLVNLQARKLSVAVDVRIESDLPQIVCDRTMVEQVLLNLARNGMQAMDSPEIRPRILKIRAQALISNPSRWLEVKVIDMGAGIPAEVEQQLFTPFFTTKTEGMGLGLSLCRTVIEQHGGVLSYSTAAKQGACFSFTLPFAQPA